MKHKIEWLPNIERLEEYFEGEQINYAKFIQNRQNDLLNDFFNPSSPVLFQGCPVKLDEKILDCNKLKNKACYNDEFYTCSNCPFENKLDILNHIFTIEYNNQKLKHKCGSIKLKERKSGKKAIPRTPGEFCIPRALLSSWIKPIIMNVSDTSNVRVITPSSAENTYTIELVHRKYRIHLKEIISKKGAKYYILKSAYYYTTPRELIDTENIKYIDTAQKRRNATSGVSTTHCIDL